MTPKVYVTNPVLPPISEYIKLIESVWESRILTNSGVLHAELELRLSEYLGISDISLINNGTIALQIAINSLGLSGSIITTPYSFIATANSILLTGLQPIFVDIEDNGFNLDPELIDEVKADTVSGIMPVHVYGIPCDVDRIRSLSRQKDLKVVYDAAHAFGVKRNGESVLGWGEASILSFHATKVFHTFEGGAIISSGTHLKSFIERQKNFGLEHNDVTSLGTNGKMNEAQAAMGLALLPYIATIIQKRKRWHALYNAQLSEVGGIQLMQIPTNVEHNYSYYPVLIKPDFPITRDELFDRFVEQNIFPRKYFYPLITDFSLYKNYSIISKHKVPNARRVADSVICLPLYPDLTESDVTRVCDVVRGV